ncbi:MAG: FAD-dependent oxidoreductase [Candidatus Omnitrophica bacterium]|nr:FAD-dependent oxidoreductase [Candidatus Omnitrophota bacterium]MDD5430067.1 FAD-dependent oxidoreductase [Candidatus Omnitrophota bacterium]
MKIYDLIILGAGPAGITAAVYAARKRLDFVVITKDIGGQASWSGDIENYTGYQFITGPQLAIKFQEHMDSFGIKVIMPQSAIEISRQEEKIKVITDREEYFSRAIIVATGKNPRLLSVEGEKEYKGKGVTYCATCDGPVFKGKNVVIVGGGNSALDAALQMVNISPKVYIVDIAPKLTGDEVMIQKLKQSSNVEVFNNAIVKKIYGADFVKGVEIEANSEIKELAVQGVFVEIGLNPNAGFASGLKKNESGEIIVDCYNQTNIEGLFAAGDVTSVPEKQIIIACGEGSKACLSAFRYLSTHSFSSQA